MAEEKKVKKDQVIIHGRNDDGDMLISRRKPDGRVSVGEAKPLEEGKPLPQSGEIVYLKGHEEGCPLYDVVDSYDLSGGEESTSSGPAKVNSPVFKANWDSVFGGSDERLN